MFEKAKDIISEYTSGFVYDLKHNSKVRHRNHWRAKSDREIKNALNTIRDDEALVEEAKTRGISGGWLNE